MLKRKRLYTVTNTLADIAMVAAFVAFILISLTGCAINVVVAPGATFAVDSLNTSDDSNNVVVNNEDL